MPRWPLEMPVIVNVNRKSIRKLAVWEYAGPFVFVLEHDVDNPKIFGRQCHLWMWSPWPSWSPLLKRGVVEALGRDRQACRWMIFCATPRNILVAYVSSVNSLVGIKISLQIIINYSPRMTSTTTPVHVRVWNDDSALLYWHQYWHGVIDGILSCSAPRLKTCVYDPAFCFAFLSTNAKMSLFRTFLHVSAHPILDVGNTAMTLTKWHGMHV